MQNVVLRHWSNSDCITKVYKMWKYANSFIKNCAKIGPVFVVYREKEVIISKPNFESKRQLSSLEFLFYAIKFLLNS